MRKSILMLATAAEMAIAGALAQPADAVQFGDIQAIARAHERLGGIEPAHCVPGVWHHRFNPHDGCIRTFVAPRADAVAIPRYRIYRWRRLHRRWSGFDIATHMAAASQSDCQIQNSTRIKVLPVIL